MFNLQYLFIRFGIILIFVIQLALIICGIYMLPKFDFIKIFHQKYSGKCYRKDISCTTRLVEIQLVTRDTTFTWRSSVIIHTVN